MPRPDHATRVSFDITEIPFSTRGAWLDISPVVGLHHTAADLHLVSHRNGFHGVLRLTPHRRDGPVEATIVADSSVLRWSDGTGHVEALFDGPDLIRVRGRGLGLRLADAANELTPFTGTYFYADPVDGGYVFTSYETGMRYRVTVTRGEVEVAGVEGLGETERWIRVDGPEWEIAVEEFATARAAWRPARTFDEAVAAADDRFAAYLDQVAPWRDATTPAATLAAYVLYSATVAPSGLLRREAVLMSMHWMDKVWSWDHCFNALALAAGDPRAALDQFLTPFDHQTPEGALPDSVTHSEVLHNYVKPPIHGWALDRMRSDLGDLDREVLAETYAKLSAWTCFWLDHRRVPGHSAAHYQHGNDSGWDNATTFDRDRLVESPDLAGFLIVQMRVLADLARELGRDRDTAEWTREHAAMVTALMDMWDGTSFVARSPITGRPASATSLLGLLPLLAASDLDEQVVSGMVDALASHLTEWGLATEPPDSPHYVSDGYWRGPIWAPSTVLLVDGLRRAGRDALATDISRRFRLLCETSGFAENFDALSGKGLRDRAYTWTASAYLVLARDAIDVA